MSGKILVQVLRFLACDAYKPYSYFEWSIQCWVNFSSLINWMDFILHILIPLSSLNDLATLPGHGGSFKNQENAVLNDPKSQKRGFWPFSWVWSVGSTWYCILWLYKLFLNIWQWYCLCWIIQKSQNCIFEWSKEPKKEGFGHFLEFGLLDWLDIAYDDKTKCFLT